MSYLLIQIKENALDSSSMYLLYENFWNVRINTFIMLWENGYFIFKSKENQKNIDAFPLRKQLIGIFSVAANQHTLQIDMEQHTELSWLARFVVFPHSMLNEGFTIIWKIRHFVTVN